MYLCKQDAVLRLRYSARFMLKLSKLDNSYRILDYITLHGAVNITIQFEYKIRV